MKKSVSIVIAVLIFATGSNALLGQAPSTTEKLASGTYVVYASSPQVWRVNVDPKTMANATIAGHFSITEGTPKNIEAFVFNDENFTKWKSEEAAVKAGAKPLYTSAGKKTDGDISVKITEPGSYYVVFSNLFAYEGTKTLVADVKFQFDKK